MGWKGDAMSEFRAAAASGTAKAEALLAECLGTPGDDLPSGANLGFLYVSDQVAGAVPKITEVLRRTTGIEDWVGTVGRGVFATGKECYDEPAMALLVAALPSGSYRILPTLKDVGAGLSPSQRRWLNEHQPPFGVVHGDPANGELPAIIDGLAEATGGFLVGGLSASRGETHHLAGALTEGGVSGVLFGPEIGVATGLSQGCMPIGPVHTITEGINNIVMTLDEKPALEVFLEDAGELLARDLARAVRYIHPAFPVSGSDTRDYLVRNLTGMDQDKGWIAVGEQVEIGDPMMFCRRDPNSAREDLRNMLSGLKDRIQGAPKAGLYISCVARGPHMFGATGGEHRLIRDVLGEFPLAGFFANGEISHNRLYGYTGVLALFL